jgi:hypothetical protein
MSSPLKRRSTSIWEHGSTSLKTLLMTTVIRMHMGSFFRRYTVVVDYSWYLQPVLVWSMWQTFRSYRLDCWRPWTVLRTCEYLGMARRYEQARGKEQRLDFRKCLNPLCGHAECMILVNLKTLVHSHRLFNILWAGNVIINDVQRITFNMLAPKRILSNSNVSWTIGDLRPAVVKEGTNLTV